MAILDSEWQIHSVGLVENVNNPQHKIDVYTYRPTSKEKGQQHLNPTLSITAPLTQ